MDTRTAAALCMLDLAPLIEAGDFRQLGTAQALIDAAVAAALTDRDCGIFLYLLGERLAVVMTPFRPESDALLRAVRATVRRKVEGRFAGRRLTSRAAGA